MRRTLEIMVVRWAAAIGLDPARIEALRGTRNPLRAEDLRPPARSEQVRAWEHRHGFRLPRALSAWLRVSNGLYSNGAPLIHPLASIGPMVPFAQVPGLVIQPESWFELGNPCVETVCVDLAYDWPGGDFPIFTSGDDASQTPPRLIAKGFVPWFLRLIQEGGRPYWLDAGFDSLGDPWLEHRRRAPAPYLPERLRPLADQVGPMVSAGVDDRSIASTLGISRWDVEALVRHIQHYPTPPG